MVSIDNILQAISQLESSCLKVHPERCLMIRNRNAKCLRCSEVCAAGAIEYDGEDLVIDIEKCIGCGTCATACPTCALEAVNPSDAMLSSQVAKLLESGNSITVSCGRALKDAKTLAEKKAQEESTFFKRVPPRFDTTELVQVVCLGRLDESFFIEAAARGAKEIKLAYKSCETCKYHKGGELARRVVESALNLLRSHGYEMSIEFVSPLPEESYAQGDASRLDYDASKRTTIQSLREMAKDGSFSSNKPDVEKEDPHFVKVSEDGTLPQFIPTRRNRILNSLRQIGNPVQNDIKTRIWGTVSIDTDKCSSCRMCAVFCPTGAIEKYETDDGRIGIIHRPYKCVQCRMCETICKNGVLTVSNEVSLESFEKGEAVAIPMKPLEWIPNRPDSIFSKMNAVLGGENNAFF